MKISDLLKENNDNEINIDNIFKTIIKGDYFQTYLKPIYDKELDQNSSIKKLRTLSINNNLTDHLFYHGSETSKNANKVLNFEYRIMPKDTVRSIHNHINNTSEQLLGEPIRNLFYITGDLSATAEYGDSYIFFPIDDAKFFYHGNIHDLTDDLELSSNMLNNSNWIDAIIDYSTNENEDNETRKLLVDFVYDIKKYIRNIIDDLSDESLKNIYERMKKYDIEKEYIEGAFNHIKSIFENKRELLNEYLKEVDTTKTMADIPDDVEVMAKPNRFVLLAMENRIEEPTDLFFELGRYYLEHYIKDQQ